MLWARATEDLSEGQGQVIRAELGQAMAKGMWIVVSECSGKVSEGSGQRSGKAGEERLHSQKTEGIKTQGCSQGDRAEVFRGSEDQREHRGTQGFADW